MTEYHALNKLPQPNQTNHEWIPAMLRKSRAATLAVVCFIFVAVLEVLDLLITRNHGIPLGRDDILIPLTYLPTACTIVIGFAWKAMVSDVKKIMPWSTMSGRFVPASDSVLLNYINSMEILSVFSALRKKHWAVVLALIVGILTGTSVTAANALIVTNFFSETLRSVKLNRTSTFDFDHTLVHPNGSLAISLDHIGAQTYGAVAAQRLPGGRYVPWTSGSHTFDSFRGPPDVIHGNETFQATVSAISVSFDCSPLRYTSCEPFTKYTGDWAITADPDDLSALNCSRAVSQKIWVYDAWLNVTACSDDPKDDRILATMAVNVEANATRSNLTSNVVCQGADYSIIGLLCSSRFYTQDATIQVNGTTGEVIKSKFTPDPESRSRLDLNVPTTGLWYYLNNPTEPRLQTELSAGSRWKTGAKDFNVYSPLPMANVLLSQTDYFFSTLVNDDVDLQYDKYSANTTAFARDVETLSNELLTQVISRLARSNKIDSAQLEGFLINTNPRVFLRRLALRALQVLLGVIGIASLLQATVLRPKSNLWLDPGPIAATALILAASSSKTELAFAPCSTSSDAAAYDHLSQHHWAFRGKSRHLNDLESAETAGISFASAPVAHEKDARKQQATTKNEGWRPFALRLDAKCLLVTILCAIIVVLAVLQAISIKHSGLWTAEKGPGLATTVVTTVVLVLLNYCCTGVDGAVSSLAPYRSLRNGSKKDPLTVSFQDVSGIFAPFRATKNRLGFAAIASSLIITVFPVIKIVAAGLFTSSLVITARPANITVDTSIVDNLSAAFSLQRPAGRAAQYAEWAITPGTNVTQRQGILKNLVFSNLTGFDELDAKGITQDDIVVATVPAIAVDVDCTSLSTRDFAINATRNGTDVSFQFGCASETCSDVEDVEEMLKTLSSSTKNRYRGHWLIGKGGKFQVIIANFTSVLGPIKTNTRLTNTSTPITATTLNVTLPTLTGATCTRSLKNVTVLTHFTRSASRDPDSTNTGTALPWAPSSFIPETLTTHSEYVLADTPNWFMPDFPLGLSLTALSAQPNVLAGPALWPSGGSASFFELLAAHATYQLNDVAALGEPAGLARAARDVYTAYHTQVFSELRPFAANASAAATSATATEGTPAGTMTAEKKMEAMVLHRHAIFKQNLPSTLLLETLLLAVLLALGWIFTRFPHAPLLPQAPGSIGARCGMLAGSALVGRLRGEGVLGVNETGAWREGAGLGWWVRDGLGEGVGDGEGRGRWRWGIDVGGGMVRGAWGVVPDGDGVAGSEEGMVGSVGDDAGSDELLEHERPDGPVAQAEPEGEREEARQWTSFWNEEYGGDATSLHSHADDDLLGSRRRSSIGIGEGSAGLRAGSPVSLLSDSTGFEDRR